MQAKNAHAIGARHSSYHSPSFGKWKTPSAPTFDSTGAPKRHTYRPLATPLHYADLAVQKADHLVAKSQRAAQKLYAKIKTKAAHNSRPVRLIAPDGIVKHLTFDHPSAFRAPVVVIRARDLSVVKDTTLITLTATAPLADAVTLISRNLDIEAADTMLARNPEHVVLRARSHVSDVFTRNLLALVSKQF